MGTNDSFKKKLPISSYQMLRLTVSQETAFKISDWIGQSMSTTPPRVHRMVKEEFTVPQQLQFDLLPSSILPLAKILDFIVPLDGVPTAPNFFSQNLRVLELFF
jgi:hypothetical protein